LDIFFQYSIYENEDVSKQAIKGIESLAKYDLEIFYGDRKSWKGLGFYPQEKVLEKIKSYSAQEQKNFLSGILAACQKMLSSTLEGTSWGYDKVTISTGSLPAEEGIKQLRVQILEVLKNVYRASKNLGDKNHIINTMKSATTTPHNSNYGSDLLQMITNDTLTILNFMKEIAPAEDMQTMQKIEHDAYWLYYHMGELDQNIGKVAFEIRDLLLKHKEYQIFRILIGFESIFHDWEKGKKDQYDYEKERQFREAEAINYSCSINDSNYDEWKERIIQYASIKSNDMATFPHFGKFLELFGKESPTLALQLLSEEAEQLQGFLVAILCGIAQTSSKDAAYQQVANWTTEGKYLFSSARFFEFANEINIELLKNIFSKASSQNDLNTLSQIIVVVTAQFKEGKENLIHEFFIPAIQALTLQKNSGWIFGFWYRTQRSDLLSAMDNEGYQAILDNLFWLNEIDYQAEEVLCKIAEKSPDLVIKFFCNRISKEKTGDILEKFRAIPFSFHKLSEPLSKIPVEAVDIIRSQYDGNYGMFIYRGALLLKNIFPQLGDGIEQKLIEVVRTGSQDDILFVLAVLRNYEGQEFLHPICKEIVSILPDESDLLIEVKVALQSAGVVCGERGFVETYQKKICEIKPWLSDDNQKLRQFAEEYISGLEKQIEYENQRVDEDIVLRKHQYGTDTEE
jgi:hypothetical protein